MKILIWVFILFSIHAFAKDYGKIFVMPKGGVLSVKDALAKLSQSEEEVLVSTAVKGDIASVCQSKGCWVTLRTGGEQKTSCEEALKDVTAQKEMRVMFKNHSFEVPKDLQGEVIVSGDIKKKKMSKYQLKHLLKDANCTKEQIAKVKKDIYQFQMTATGLQTL